MFHYTTYRYLKDTVFLETFNIETTFLPSFIAGVVAITVSQPLEVIRNHVSLNNLNGSLIDFLGKYTRQYGWKGYFYGFVPRLIRKPVNSGISWSFYEYFMTKK